MERSMSVAVTLAMSIASITLAAEPLPLEPLPVSFGQRPRAASLEYCASNADRIVAGRLTELSEPKKITLRQPYGAESGERVVREGKLEIIRSFLDRGQSSGGRAEDKRTTITFVVDAPESDVVDRLNRYYLSLKSGADYLLLLQKRLDADGFYLPARAHCVLNFGDRKEASVAAIEHALDRESWAWGEEVRGLQIGLLTTNIAESLGETIDDAHPERLMPSIVLRNRSEKPIPLNLYPLDTMLTISAAAEQGAKQNLSEGAVERLQLPRRGEKTNIELQPGQMIFVDRFGKTDGVSWSPFFVKSPGKWRLRATLELRDASIGGGAVLEGTWKGTLRSAEVLETGR